MEHKLFVTNRKNQKIALIVETSQKQKGLVFVMHGLGGFKEQDHIKAFAEAFKEEAFTVVRFDTTNSLGESDGKYEDATTTNYFEDLEDLIAWSKKQPWYKEPFWLCGHSLGGISTTLYAQKYPQKVKGLVPISTVVSGKLSIETPRYKGNDILKKWKETGLKIEESTSRPGFIKKLKWSHIEDRLQYDVLPQVEKLQMPVLLIVGDQDEATPLEHQQILFDRLPGKKELHIVKGAPHTFREQKHLAEIKKVLKKWIEKNNPT